MGIRGIGEGLRPVLRLPVWRGGQGLVLALAGPGGLRRFRCGPAAEGEGHGAAHDGQSRRQNGPQAAGPVGDEGDALGHGPPAGGHGGGGAEKVPRAPAAGHHGQEGLAVVDPLRLPQPADGRLVAGQLAVPAAQGGGPPDQGIIPVEGQTDPPEQGPDVVPVAVVDILVGENVVQPPALQGRFIEVDSGPEQAEQAGGGQVPGHIDPQSPCPPGMGQVQGPAGPPQAEPEGQIGPGQHAAQGRRPGPPEEGQPAAVLPVRPGRRQGGRRRLPGRRGLQGEDRARRQAVRVGGVGLHRGHRRRDQGPPQLLRRPHHAHRRREQDPGDQQA